MKSRVRPLVALASLSEYRDRIRQPAPLPNPQASKRKNERAFREVCVLFDVCRHQAATCTGLSRARLCCALRLSQPLDALIPPDAYQPCFMLEHP
jgi:hypothetical protein